MSEALIGFNFHFLLFAMAWVGAAVWLEVTGNQLEARGEDRTAGLSARLIFGVVIFWGSLEFLYWTARFVRWLLFEAVWAF